MRSRRVRLLWAQGQPAALVRGANWQEPRGVDVRLEDAYRLNNQGWPSSNSTNYDAAAASFAKALELVPSLQLARINLAIALLHAGKLPEAEREPSRPSRPTRRRLNRTTSSVWSPEATTVQRLRPPHSSVCWRSINTTWARESTWDSSTCSSGATTRPRRCSAPRSTRSPTMPPLPTTSAWRSRGAGTRRRAAGHGALPALRASGYATTFSKQLPRAWALRGGPGFEGHGRRPRGPCDPCGCVRRGSGPRPHNRCDRGRARPCSRDAGRPRQDGDLDLITAGPGGASLFTNSGTRLDRASDETQPPWSSSTVTSVVVADYDNDLSPDIALAGESGLVLLRQASPGRFENVSATREWPVVHEPAPSPWSMSTTTATSTCWPQESTLTPPGQFSLFAGLGPISG